MTGTAGLKATNTYQVLPLNTEDASTTMVKVQVGVPNDLANPHEPTLGDDGVIGTVATYNLFIKQKSNNNKLIPVVDDVAIKESIITDYIPFLVSLRNGELNSFQN